MDSTVAWVRGVGEKARLSEGKGGQGLSTPGGLPERGEAGPARPAEATVRVPALHAWKPIVDARACTSLSQAAGENSTRSKHGGHAGRHATAADAERWRQ
jgi:hypothetical protein